METATIVELIVLGLLFIMAVLASYLRYVKDSLDELRLEFQIQQREVEDARMKLMEKIREKIEITQRTRKPKCDMDDLVAQFIYRQDCVQDLGSEMLEIYANEYSTLRLKYPSLTNLDLLILALLGNDMDNVEICSLLKMEKRTLYRRRQLIAQRMGVSSTVLDEFAKSIFMMDGTPATEEE